MYWYTVCSEILHKLNWNYSTVRYECEVLPTHEMIIKIGQVWRPVTQGSEKVLNVVLQEQIVISNASLIHCGTLILISDFHGRISYLEKKTIVCITVGTITDFILKLCWTRLHPQREKGVGSLHSFLDISKKGKLVCY